jgi:hypothetical protein
MGRGGFGAYSYVGLHPRLYNVAPLGLRNLVDSGSHCSLGGRLPDGRGSDGMIGRASLVRRNVGQDGD